MSTGVTIAPQNGRAPRRVVIDTPDLSQAEVEAAAAAARAAVLRFRALRQALAEYPALRDELGWHNAMHELARRYRAEGLTYTAVYDAVYRKR